MKTRNRLKGFREFASGPMADIAFLLLIFFLVTSTFQHEKGIKTTLPPLQGIVQNNGEAIEIMLNENKQILLNETHLTSSQLYNELVILLTNQGSSKGIHLSTSENISYNDYLEIYDTIRRSIRSVRNIASQSEFGASFDLLDQNNRSKIEAQYPLKVSERFVSTSI